MAAKTKTEKTEEKVEKIVKTKRPSSENKSAPQSELDDNSSEVKKKSKISKKLLEKAKELAGKIEEVKDIDLKKQIKPEEEEKKNALVPMEHYLKASIHLGTKVITPDMRQYIYRRRADGLAVFNTALLDDKIREAAEFISQYAPKDILLVCKREAGWKAADLFSQITGIRVFAKKYPTGILTNTKLSNFIETDLVIIADPWLDKNALNDAINIKIPVLSICDTNNYTAGITKVLPGNNKSARSLGIIFYLLAKIYNEKRKLGKEIPPISQWIDNWDNLEAPK